MLVSSVGSDHKEGTTELDSHANMFVVGHQAFVYNRTGLHAHVNAFSEEAGGISKVPIVDAVIAYDCKYSGETYMLVIRNALHIPSMKHNLVPPFILREAGLTVNDTPKIQCKEPSIEDHSVYDDETGLRIQLQLDGIFSVFPTRALTKNEINHVEDYMYVDMTPNGQEWDPYDESYAINEASLVDHKGEMKLPPMQATHTLVGQADIMNVQADIPPGMPPSLQEENPLHPPGVGSPTSHPGDFSGEMTGETTDQGGISNMDIDPMYLARGDNPQDDFDKRIDETIASSVIASLAMDRPSESDIIDEDVKHNLDPIRAQVSSISAVYDPQLLCDLLDESIAASKFGMAVGSTVADDYTSECELFINSIQEAFAGATHAEKPKGISPQLLEKIWGIDNETAKRTLKTTTQLNRQDANSKLSRNFGTNDRMLRYRRINSFFFSDTFFVTGKAKSTRGYTCMQIFVSDKGYVYVVPMTSAKEFPKALKMFAKEVGVPTALIVDPHRSNKSKEVKAFCHKIGTTLRVLEESTQFANRAELYVGFVKEAVRRDTREQHSPLVFWDYCAERRANILNMTAKNLFQLQGQTPHFATFGEEGDISNICQFGWYEWVYFREGSEDFPYMTESLARCLGPAKNEGNEMTQWCLKMNGYIVPRRTIRRLTPEELVRDSEISKRKEFDEAITKRYGNSFSLPKENAANPQEPDESGYFELPFDEVTPKIPDADNNIVDANGKALNPCSIADTLVNAEVMLPQGEDLRLAKVVRRTLDADGNNIGHQNDNPILNTMLYDVEFPDGAIHPYAANTIAENILQSVDDKGYHNQLLECILEHEKSERAIKKEDQYVVTRRGQRKLRETTVGWTFHVKWKDGTKTWIPLKVLKESNPVLLAEYAKEREINDEPAFSWWVPYTLRKRDRIIAAVQHRVRKSTHKYGIEVPISVEHALAIDKRNGNTFWRDAIRKEMANVGIAFQILEEHESLPPAYTKSSGHMIFDVKMDFTLKARWVKDGHRTPNSETSSYAGVVSRESIRIMLTHAALHDVDVMAADIRNAYLQAPTSEKHYIICGPEFGIENVGKRAIITRALYGGKVAGRDFWHHLRSCMDHLGFTSSKADPDVWMRESVREKTGEAYYEYVLLYVDDCLVMSDRADSILRSELNKYFMLKEESIGAPSQYLGGKLRMVELENGQKAWAFGSKQYVETAVNNVVDYLSKRKQSLPARCPTPMTANYRPEIDVTEELGPQDASYYHSLIGILRWIVELGRVDINVEVSMMSSHLALPREGHLQEVLHIFGYLKKHMNSEMVFDPSEPEIDMNEFKREDWGYSIYSSPGEELKEELPPKMPKPLGKAFKVRGYVDADHAGELLTRRSRTGFIIFLNKSPIYWHSKKNQSIETSTFGSEFMAMKQVTEYMRGLRYKLRMFGIPIDGPAFIYGDNQSVLCNTSMPKSTLKKKSQSIAFHFVREGCARDEWRTTYVNTHLNVADLMTKPLAGDKRWFFIRMLLHHL